MKKRIILISFFISFSTLHFAQNLVPNGSLEYQIQCNGGSNMHPLSLPYAVPWYNPFTTVSTTDLFNACDSVPNVPYWPNYNGIPLNMFGYQYPRTGNNMGGFKCYGTHNEVKEYGCIPLTDTLEAGVTYNMRYYISLGEMNQVWMCCFLHVFAINNMGFLLTDTMLHYPSIFGSEYLPYPATVEDSSRYWDDTLGWMAVTGSYLAQGGETNLTIGNFIPSIQITNAQLIKYNYNFPGSISQGWAYYYFDDVALWRSDTIAPVAGAGADTMLCRGDSIVIGTHNYPDYLYRWWPSTGLSSSDIGQPVASPLSTTTYYVEVTDFKYDKTMDTVTVYVKKCGPNAGNDTLVCAEQPLVLGDSLNIGYQCQWTPSTNLSSDTVPMPFTTPCFTITYYLEVFDSLGLPVKTDSITIRVVNCYSASAGPDMTICIDDTVTIGIHNHSSCQYVWSPNRWISDTTHGMPSVWPQDTITYCLTVTDTLGNITTDSVTITTIDCDTVGINEKWKEGRYPGIVVWPNPVKSQLNVYVPENQPEDIYFELWAITGRCVSKTLLHGGLNRNISLKELPAGIYLYKVFISERLSKTGKLIIEK